MSEWLVQLTGKEFELETVTRLFNLPELSIIKEGSDYFLQSEDFRALSDAHDIYKCAQKMLPFYQWDNSFASTGCKKSGST